MLSDTTVTNATYRSKVCRLPHEPDSRVIWYCVEVEPEIREQFLVMLLPLPHRLNILRVGIVAPC